jgi:putative heme-binding domain-containing protein
MYVQQSVRNLYAVVRWTVLLMIITLYCPLSAAQEAPVSNPAAGNPAAIREGESLFRANCSPCHGRSAHGGGKGPDLTSGRWNHGAADADLFRTISQGVAGTEMAAANFEDSEIWTIIAYLRSLAPPKSTAPAGDSANGEAIFERKGCLSCHMVKGRGGLLGPDLSRVGAGRSSAYLVDSIRTPDKDLSIGMIDPNSHFGPPRRWNTVTVVTSTGEKIVGVARNEDTFSIQLMDRHQNLHLLLKNNLQEVTREEKSLMPAYADDMLNAGELRDLVSYLQSLRGD